ncbi:MAG TPA: hypothetical protein VK570_08880 [Rubrivivax sp.]|jgi:hypothetical protein|nr:hypothetical protein [Rubrivivax sp.]
MNSNPQSGPDKDDPALQGEGNYTAARRHRESLENFIESGQVEDAARDAEPQSTAEERELQEAEEAGRERAKK